MLTALRNTPDANAILPFVRLFYGSPSEFAPKACCRQSVANQGDPLVPALFAPWPRPACYMHADLVPDGSVGSFATTHQPCHTAFLLQRLEQHLLSHAHIQFNAARTRVWNAARIRPAGPPPQPNCMPDHVGLVTGSAQTSSLRRTLATSQRSTALCASFFPDLHVASLFRVCRASPRAQSMLRAVPPVGRVHTALPTCPCALIQLFVVFSCSGV